MMRSIDYWAEFISRPVPDFRLPLFRSAALQDELLDMAEAYPRRYYLSPRVVLRELWRDRVSPRRLWRKAQMTGILLRAGAQRRMEHERRENVGIDGRSGTAV